MSENCFELAFKHNDDAQFARAWSSAICSDSTRQSTLIRDTLIRHWLFLPQVPGGPPGQPAFKLNIVESIERIKDEFNFLQAQYHK